MPQPSATPSATSAPAPRRHPYVPGMFKAADNPADGLASGVAKEQTDAAKWVQAADLGTAADAARLHEILKGLLDGEIIPPARGVRQGILPRGNEGRRGDAEEYPTSNNRRYIACAIPVAGALMKIDPKAARDVFEKYATDGAVRSSLMAAFIRLDSSYESEIWPLLSSDQRIVADEAVYILGRIGNSKSIPQMQALANDPARSNIASLKRASTGPSPESKKREDKKPG